MKATSSGRLLSTVFVDYDNIYLSLKRKSEDAAKAFAKNAPLWLKEIESGRLITPTNGPGVDIQRRIVMNRCYGNPVPRRNQSDNSTDMNSFPFVRHHFLRAGFEVVDCPPLTAQLKNSSDIRMVMDVRDYLNHDTYFEEFVILSGDADFTPLLHRLRAHARRTVIFANDYTASPYTAISDGEIRESDLIAFLTGNRLTTDAPVAQITTGDSQPLQQAQPLAPAQPALPSPQQLEIARRDIITEVVSVVRMTTHPVPLEALADRAVRNLGHEKTAGSAWGGAGTFRELLQRALPQGLKLSEQPPYFVYDTTRQNRNEVGRGEQTRAAETLTAPAPRSEAYEALARPEQAAPATDRAQQAPVQPAYQPQAHAYGQPQVPTAYQQAQPQAPAYQPQAFQQSPAQQQPVQRPTEAAAAYQHQLPNGFGAPSQAPAQAAPQRTALPPLPQPAAQTAPPLATLQQPYRSQQGEQIQQRLATPPAAPAPQPQPQQRQTDTASAIQQSIARIHEACQAPPLSPPEYRALFDIMAQEINSNGLLGAQTLTSISARAQELGIELRRDDVRFVLEVVSEADPWFEQGASASLFASRFRNFVVARCRGQGLNLTAEELDLIEAWFAASAQQTAQRNAPVTAPRAPAAQPAPAQQAPLQQQTGTGERWWNLDEGRPAQADANDEMPRIVRARQRG